MATRVDDKQMAKIAFVLAGIAHDKWWGNYRKKNPSTPRIKKLDDGTEIDINNCALNCPRWIEKQAESQLEYIKVVNLNAQLDENASRVHDVWMEMNSWEHDTSPHLFVPFDELAEEEKEKDRDIVRIIQNEFAKYSE
jgi:hypothetical protein